MREEDTVCVGSDGLKYCKVCGEAKEAFLQPPEEISLFFRLIEYLKTKKHSPIHR